MKYEVAEETGKRLVLKRENAGYIELAEVIGDFIYDLIKEIQLGISSFINKIHRDFNKKTKNLKFFFSFTIFMPLIRYLNKFNEII